MKFKIAYFLLIFGDILALHFCYSLLLTRIKNNNTLLISVLQKFCPLVILRISLLFSLLSLCYFLVYFSQFKGICQFNMFPNKTNFPPYNLLTSHPFIKKTANTRVKICHPKKFGTGFDKTKHVHTNFNY